jgi:hypothetical protein
MSTHEDSPWFLEFLLLIAVYSFFIICLLLSMIYFNQSFFNLVFQYLVIALLASTTAFFSYKAYVKRKAIMSILRHALRVRRRLAIALGTACIILSVSLVGTITLCVSQIPSLNSQVSSLESQVVSLSNIVNLNTSEVLEFNRGAENIPGDNVAFTFFNVSYSGYVSFAVNYSTSFPITIQVWYSNYGVSYSVNKTIDNLESFVFPVVAIPTNPTEVDIGIYFGDNSRNLVEFTATLHY